MSKKITAKDILNVITKDTPIKLETTEKGVVVEQQSVQGNTIYTEPNSEVINTLSKRVIEQDLYPADINFFTQKWFPINFKLNGIIDNDYEVKVLPAELGDPYADFKEEDLAKGAEIVVRETIELDKNDIIKYDFHIWDFQVRDFAISPDKALTILNTLANAKTRSLWKNLQYKVVNIISNSITEVIDVSGVDIIEKQKQIDMLFTKYGSESDTLISDNINGTTYFFDTQFNSNEFYMLVNKNYSADFKVDFKRNSFQLGNTGVSYPVKDIAVRDFSTTIGLRDIESIQTLDILFIHKDSILNMGHFELSKLMGTLSGYTKGKEYVKANAFKIKGKPIIGLQNNDLAPAPTATISNVVPTNPTTAEGTDGNIVFDVNMVNGTGSETATLNPVSGTSAITLVNGANNGLTFENLPAGTYSIEVKDENDEVIQSQTGITLTDPVAK